MFEMATTLGDLSMQVKIGWAIWLAWGVVVLGWYRHARVVAPMAAVSAAAGHAVRFTDLPATPQQEFAPEPMTASALDTNNGSSTYTELNEYSEIPAQR
ncbi:MAG: hypothetical protein HOP16_14175 [Acidobacteria bacterium]|nr:hypothetical protein [Acidobacteriota bacterium]